MSGVRDFISNEKRTMIDLTLHLAAGIAGSCLFYQWFSAFDAMMFLCGSVLIDLDHLIDYIVCFGPGVSIKRFFRREFIRSDKVYIPFHSWELVALLFIFGVFLKGLSFLAFGMLVHMVIDYLYHHLKTPLFYSLFYRFQRGFSYSRLDPQGYEKEMHRLQN